MKPIEKSFLMKAFDEETNVIDTNQCPNMVIAPMKTVWSNCMFFGSPPIGYNDWSDFAQAYDKYGVFVCALEDIVLSVDEFGTEHVLLRLKKVPTNG